LLLVLVGVLASAPAQADPEPSSYSSWVSREDGATPDTDTTTSLSGPDAGLRVSAWDDQLAVLSDPVEGPDLGANFVAPAGQTLSAGVTYRVEDWRNEYSSSAARLFVRRDGLMCGKTDEELSAGPWEKDAATGWFHVSELERDTQGEVTRFAATYELNCQFFGGQPGLEGSIAVNATTPATPVPDAPATPGPVTDLRATNVGPDGSGANTTTLTWHNPATDFGDVIFDMAQSEDPANLTPGLGSYEDQQNLGSASRWQEKHIDFMDTRTYQLVTRGTTGRLGPATRLLVQGSRLDIPDRSEKITIGHEVQVSGRLSLNWDYVNPADVMKGPGLVGRTVVMCRQARVPYVDGACTPVDRTTTTAGGHFTLSATPMENSIYQVMVPATSQMIGNLGWVVTTQVAPQTDLKAPEAEAANARASVRRGSVIHFTTSRARAGSRGIVRLQRKDGHTWHTLKTERFSSAKGSRVRRLAVPYRERAPGSHLYRMVKLADSHHVNGYSRLVRVQVR